MTVVKQLPVLALAAAMPGQLMLDAATYRVWASCAAGRELHVNAFSPCPPALVDVGCAVLLMCAPHVCCADLGHFSAKAVTVSRCLCWLVWQLVPDCLAMSVLDSLG